MSLLKTKAATGAKFTTISVTAVSVLQVIQLIVLGRLLGPEVFGLIALIQIVIHFSQMMMDMGITDAIIHKERVSREALSSLYWFSIGTGAFIFLLLFFLAPAISAAFQATELTPLIRSVGIAFVILPFGLQFQTIATKNLEFKDLAKYETFSGFLGVLVTISMVLFFGLGVWSVVWGYLTSAAAKTIPWTIKGFREMDTRPDFYYSWDSIKDLVIFGMYRVGTNTANYINTKIDQIVIGIMLGPQILGLYSMGINLVMQPIQKLNPMISRLSLPIFSQILNDKARLKKWYLFIIHLMMLLNGPLFAGLFVLAPFVIPLMLGEEWAGSIPIVQILCVYALFLSLGNPSGSLFIAVGKVRWSFYWQVGLLFVIPAVAYTSALTGDIVQVAISMALLSIVLYYLNYLLRIRLIIGNCLRELLQIILKPIGHSIIMGLLLSVLLLFLQGMDDLTVVVISVSSGAVAYVGLLIIFEKNLLNELNEFIRRKRVSAGS